MEAAIRYTVDKVKQCSFDTKEPKVNSIITLHHQQPETLIQLHAFMLCMPPTVSGKVLF